MKKGLIVLLGEAFREYNPFALNLNRLSRVRDTEYGIEKQRESSMSHVKLERHLASLNYTIDFALHTYTTANEEMLRGFYPNVVYAKFTEPNPTIASMTESIFHTAVQSVLSSIDIQEYSFMFVCRFDLMLKDELIQRFNPEWNTITYANVMSIANDDVNQTCISDVLVFIPCRFFLPFHSWKGLYYNTIHILCHHCVQALIRCGLRLRDDIAFMTDACYIANTIQMKNPLYAINCRPDGPEFIHGWSDIRYDKDRHICRALTL